MAAEIVIRSGPDRVRYALMFEAGIIIVFGVFASVTMDRDFTTTGSLGVALSVIALVVNLVFNSIYDRIDARRGRVPTERNTSQRIVHAVLFELLLVVISLPVIVWWLGIGWWQALLLDAVMMLAVVIYTYYFTLTYDRLFPVPQSN